MGVADWGPFLALLPRRSPQSSYARPAAAEQRMAQGGRKHRSRGGAT